MGHSLVGYSPVGHSPMGYSLVGYGMLSYGILLLGINNLVSSGMRPYVSRAPTDKACLIVPGLELAGTGSCF